MLAVAYAWCAIAQRSGDLQLVRRRSLGVGVLIGMPLCAGSERAPAEDACQTRAIAIQHVGVRRPASLGVSVKQLRITITQCFGGRQCPRSVSTISRSP
jgi:hypothetical protein